MESALAWIGKIAEWVGAFIPRWIILDVTMGGCKYVGGKKLVPLGPGVHFYWPARTTIDTYPIARQTDDLRSQTLVTTDDRTIVVGGMITYKVNDIAKLLGSSFHAPTSIKIVALAAIHNVCCRMSWAELKLEQQRGTLDTKLKNTARRELEDYGVTVIDVQLTDLAPTRVYKLMQSTSKDEE